MKNIILIMFCCCCSLHSWADTKKIVLITSLMETPTIKRSKNKKLEAYLEKKFRQKFKDQGFDITVKHLANPSILWDALNDKSIIGIFWVSHSRKEKAISSNLIDPGQIVDAYGNDVKNFFRVTTSHLRFLSIIGCEAEMIIEKFKDDGHYNFRPLLNFKMFSKKIEAKKGFKDALTASDGLFENSSFQDETEMAAEKHHFRFIKKNAISGQLLKIELGGNIIGLISSESGLVNLEITSELWEKLPNANIKMTILKTEVEDKMNQELPLYQITINGKENLYKIFAKDDKAMGSGQNLYIYYSTKTMLKANLTLAY